MECIGQDCPTHTEAFAPLGTRPACAEFASFGQNFDLLHKKRDIREKISSLISKKKNKRLATKTRKMSSCPTCTMNSFTSTTRSEIFSELLHGLALTVRLKLIYSERTAMPLFQSNVAKITMFVELIIAKLFLTIAELACKRISVNLKCPVVSTYIIHLECVTMFHVKVMLTKELYIRKLIRLN